VLVVLCPLEIDRYHVTAARVAAGHLHIRVRQSPPVAWALVVVQKYLYLQLPVQFPASSERNYLLTATKPILPYGRVLSLTASRFGSFCGFADPTGYHAPP